MPLYEYRCKACGHRFEKIQSFSAPDEKECPVCKGEVERLISAPAVRFSGSGFYSTDYPSKSSGAPKSDGGGSSESKSGDSSASASKDSSSGTSGDGGSKTNAGAGSSSPSSSPAPASSAPTSSGSSKA